jgi:predicted transposase YdaD
MGSTVGSADITLRHIVRSHPEALVEAMEIQARVEVVGWFDTQVTALERRLDKALVLRMDGALRALQAEFEVTLRIAQMDRRVREYQSLFHLGRSAGDPEQPQPPIESVVVVLTGRRKPWPTVRKVRISWPEGRWAGHRYRIDAVYQRTVAELMARGSVLWLVFTPLARDANVPALRKVVAALRARVADPAERADLYAALLVMAELDPWGYAMRKEIEAMLQDDDGMQLIRLSKTLSDAFARGKEEGVEEGVKQGVKKGVKKGRRQAIETMLRRLFLRRLGRPLTEEEQQALVQRARQQDPEEVEDRALSLEGEALAAWLLDPEAR